MPSHQDHLLSEFRKAFVGNKVVNVKYMNQTQRDDNGWNSRAVVIEFEDGSTLSPMRDDEGNDAGALSWNAPNHGFKVVGVL